MATVLGLSRAANGVRIRATKTGPVVEQTWSYIVEADYAEQSRVEILQTANIVPGLTTVDGICVLRSISGEARPNNPRIWDFTADFSSEVEENAQGSNSDPTSDPITWISIYQTKFERLVEAASQDVNGDAIANSAGGPFEVGVMIPRYLPIWEFYQFEPASVTDEQIIERNEVVNDATFRGRAAKTLLCTVLSSEIGFYYGQRRRLTQYQLKYNWKKWTHKRQDTGTYYLESGNSKSYMVDGQIILGPLNGSGGKAASGAPPRILDFDIYESVSFSFLRI